MSESTWQNYEQVARHILTEFRQHFGLDAIEPKQDVPGQSGTGHEIDAKGVMSNGEGFLVIECRKRNAKPNKEDLCALAYRIIDTGAAGGIIVSTVPLQSGAAKIAQASGTISVILNTSATAEEFCVQFFDKGFARMADTIGVGTLEAAKVAKFDEDV
jgi:hypothetical protein